MLRVEVVKELLAPGLWMFAAKHPDIDFGLEIDHGNLVVKGYHKPKKFSLGFAITEGQLESKVYIESFQRNLDALASLLNNATEQDIARYG